MSRIEDNSAIHVLWLRPTKPDNISVGRERIAEYLREWGYKINIQNASRSDAVSAILTGIRGSYDVVIGTVRMGLYVGSLLSVITRTPIIADVTDPIEQINDLPLPIYKLLFEIEHLAISNAEEAMFVYNTSYKQAKCRGIDGKKVENAVNYEKFNDPDPEVIEIATSELNEAGLDNRPIAIYIGGLTPVYHIESILATAQALDTVQFLFIGDGELSEKVTRAADDMENVFYLGTYDHKMMPGFLAVSDVGLCLVDAEQPLKVLEYGAAGLPVVAVPGELQERFTDEELLFTHPDEELADAILTLINNPDLARHYGTNLNQRAANTRWIHVADKYKQAIDRAIHD